MTKAQLNKLHRLTGQTEALQKAVPSGRAQEAIAKAKNALMDAIRAAENEITR